MNLSDAIEDTRLAVMRLNRRKAALFAALFAILCIVWGHYEWEYDRTLQLQNAAAVGDTRAVKALLDGGVSPNTQNRRGQSALPIAAYYGHADTVRLLLDRGATPDKGLRAAAQEGHTDILAMLLARGASIHGETGASTLGYAVDSGDLPAVTLLLKQGVQLNLKDEYGTLPIQRAACRLRPDRGSWPIFRALIDYGADVKALSTYGETTLMYAVRDDNPDSERICRYLIRHGVNVNARDNEQKTALIHAVEFRRGDESGGRGLAILNLLLKSGADVTVQDKYGRTAFRYASEFRDSGAKARLRSAGAR